MHYRNLSVLVSIALLLCLGAGAVETAEAQSMGVLGTAVKALGTFTGVMNMLAFSLISILFLPIDLVLLALSFTSTGTSITNLILPVMSFLEAIGFMLLYIPCSMVGLKNLFKGYVQGFFSPPVWFIAKWVYFTRVLFLAGERAAEAFYV